MTWKVVFSTRARRDAEKLAHSGLKDRAEAILTLLRTDPFGTPPPYEKLVGELAGVVSRRITILHRVVYQVLEEERIVKVLRMWTHYE